VRRAARWDGLFPIELPGPDALATLAGELRELRPSALARRAGLHSATITGILDRLERGSWAARDRDPSDRRALLVRALPDRNGDLMRLYSGMSASINKLLSGYGDTELELIADFLRRTANAGQNAADELADD
jgi:DNA-binding MarR family transcriptional regulator